MTPSTPSFDVLPLSPLRKAIAAQTAEAKRTIPHYRVSMDIRMDHALALRSRANQRNPHHRISVNDIVIKACAAALVEQPELNIQLAGDEIHRYHQANIAVVVAVPGGLSTPIIRAAETKTVEEISREVRALTERAVKNQLKRSEIVGGTFSISNLGMYGVDDFDAVINPPQCAILAVGAIRDRPVVQRDGVVAAALMKTTLSLDHRAIDGATGATFLRHLRETLEHPAPFFAAEER
jgi:pyruvate dehydrogenase E2 component (dihydrolipoyllysine-residue acetyltransferase)